MNNNKLIWLALGVVLILTILAAGTVAYLDQGRELRATQNQVQQFQTEQASLKQQLETKDKEIKLLESGSSEIKAEKERLLGQTHKLRADLETVGDCLNGVTGLINAAANEDRVRMIASAGALKEPCSKSQIILNKLKANAEIGNSY